jgi:hypothetical protein
MSVKPMITGLKEISELNRRIGPPKPGGYKLAGPPALNGKSKLVAVLTTLVPSRKWKL